MVERSRCTSPQLDNIDPKNPLTIAENNKTETKINYHSEEIDYQLDNSEEISQWIDTIISNEGKSYDKVDFIFCSDDYLLEINRTYLDHDYYTDIITFPLNDNPIEANVFVSIDRLRENAQLYKVKLEDELHRVIIHGILHLIGYSDKTEADQLLMRNKENACLAQRCFI